jgi:hypothetical protein
MATYYWYASGSHYIHIRRLASLQIYMTEREWHLLNCDLHLCSSLPPSLLLFSYVTHKHLTIMILLLYKVSFPSPPLSVSPLYTYHPQTSFLYSIYLHSNLLIIQHNNDES